MTIGNRIKEERERLGLTQPVFAAAASTKKGSIINWEKGASAPTAFQLEGLATLGVDIQYVVTGKRAVAAIDVDPEVNELVSLYRKASLAVKAAAIRVLSDEGRDSPSSSAPASKFNISGNVGQVTQGKVKGGVTVNMGDSKAPKKK